MSQFIVTAKLLVDVDAESPDFARKLLESGKFLASATEVICHKIVNVVHKDDDKDDPPRFTCCDEEELF